ncbi:MAG: STAS domain-containing protein [Burkholderiaceae bacterium]
MNEEQGPKSGGRFLSKVVKFITSPTTDWADLNKVGGQDDAGESSAALKEMIERKRRNDFVRNREFDMLRKARRRQLAGANGGAVAPTSFISSVESAHPHEPERTLEKIDLIEEQMSRAWLDRAEPTAAAPDNPRAYDKTRPVQLGEVAGGVGFGTTAVEVPLSGAAAQVSRGESAPRPEQSEPLGPPTGPGPWSDPVPSAPMVEAPEAVAVSPEVEEVAIRFANGDASGAEVSLLELLGEGGSHSDDLETWLTLFDLYRAAGESDKFDGAAIAFVGRFGRSAPQWELAASPGSEAMPMLPLPGGASAPRSETQPAHWSAPAVLGTQSIAALNASMARQAPPWRIDWRRVKSIDLQALPPLLDVLQRWAQAPVRLRFLGAEQLLTVLAQQTPAEQRQTDPQWWATRLALLRVMDDPDEFEMVALNYCVTYEMSPPAWEDPRCDFAPMTESGHTLPPPDDEGAAQATASAHSEYPLSEAMATAGATGPEVARLPLEGEILGDAAHALQPLTVSARTRSIEFNCRHLQRVDFGAAGDLLNWAVQQQGQGRQVVFKHVNRLVAAFFGVIGISDAARVLRRID